MKKGKLGIIVILLILISVNYCSQKEKPWVGTYMLMVSDENREVFDALKEANRPWPHVNIMEDGTFTLFQPQASGSGVYRVEGTQLIMTLTEYNGNPPSGNLAQRKTIETKNNFQYIMFEGPNGEPWIKLPDE
jgi:hypothetical protein